MGTALGCASGLAGSGCPLPGWKAFPRKVALAGGLGGGSGGGEPRAPCIRNNGTFEACLEIGGSCT